MCVLYIWFFFFNKQKPLLAEQKKKESLAKLKPRINLRSMIKLNENKIRKKKKVGKKQPL